MVFFFSLLSITSTWIETVRISEAYSYCTIQNQRKEFFFTNCSWKRPCFLRFLMDHVSLCLPKYSIRYLLRKSHHRDDAEFYFLLVIVLKNERMPSEYNELRQGKASRSSQDRNKEVCQRNKRFM